MRVQDPYVSKVMKKAAHLSRDQLYLAAQFLGFASDVQAYLELLHDYQTSVCEPRRATLLTAIKRQQKAHLDTGKHLAATAPLPPTSHQQAYYLDPFNQIVHMALSIPRYGRALDLLAKDLMVPKDRIRRAVDTLVDLGVVERTPQGGCRSIVGNVHLPRESPLYSAWETSLKALAQARRAHLERDVAYAFSVVFSADEKTRLAMLERILGLIKSLQPLVEGAPEEDVYQISIDLFSWTRDRA